MSGEAATVGLGTALWNALSLNANFYENARNTPQTHRIAIRILILASLSHMLGSFVILLINRAGLPIMVLALALDVLSVVGGYLFWTLTIWYIGKWLSLIHI